MQALDRMAMLLNTYISVGVNQLVGAIDVISELFHPENVTVTLGWEQKNGYTYGYEVISDQDSIFEINHSKTNSIQLTVLYNVRYSVRVVAQICGRDSTNVTEVYFGRCYVYMENV